MPLVFKQKPRRKRGLPQARERDSFHCARKKGVLVTRRKRVLTDDEIAEIAAVYHHYRDKKGNPQDVAGFCKTTALDDVRTHDYKLTPGIYVGTEQNNVDDTPFEEKMTELTAQLKAQFAESNALQEKILKNLEELVNETNGESTKKAGRTT